MKILKKYLFNNDKLNIKFFFILTFFFFLILSFLLIQYETFIYQKYTNLYKQQTIYHLSYDIVQILKSDISDASKLSFCYSLADAYLKDENIKEIWITDNEWRLFFSTDPKLMKEYHSQKLPAFYYPLYEKKFKTKNNHFLPNISNALDKLHTYILLPIKINESSPYDYTIGLKIRKKHFWLEKNPVVLFPTFLTKDNKKASASHPLMWNYSIFVLYLIFIFISFLLSLIFTILISSLLTIINTNFQIVTHKLKDFEDYSDVNTIKLEETDNYLFKNFVIAFNNLIQHILFKKNEECEKNTKAKLNSNKNQILFTVQSTLFPLPVTPVHGFLHNFFYSNKNMQTHHIVQIKNIDSFKTSFLITKTNQPDFATMLTEYNYIYHIFHSSNDAKSICVGLNDKILSLSNSQISGVAGYIDTTTNLLTLYSSGLSLIFYYKASTNSITSEFQKEPLFGVLQKEDYGLKLQEEKIKMDMNDILIVFNDDILTDQLTINNLKEKVLENVHHTPETMINYLSDYIKLKNVENIFLFILKKK